MSKIKISKLSSKTKNSNEKSLGSLLKSARKAKNLSQGDVAKKLGYTTSQFISNIERNLANPPLGIIRKLVQLYGMNSEHIRDMLLVQYEKKVVKALKIESVSKSY
jgi:transcriptional regulator with XRE-family HTH domain